MGGAEVVIANRKRKRKTRSERNHLLRFPHMSLRSNKSTALPMARNIGTCQTITQGRLTRGVNFFTYSKSSDCISRGPIPETASVKKKVEEDLRRIINPAASPKIGCSGDVQNNIDKAVVSVCDIDGNNSALVTEQNENRQITSSVCSEVHKTNSAVQTQTASPVVSTSQTVDKTKACIRSNTCVSSSSKSENDLDEVLPVNDIAEKILQNLKPKFKKLFPKRDLNVELNSNLEKLLRQSSKKISISSRNVAVSTCSSLRLPQMKENSGNQKTSSVTVEQSTCTLTSYTSTLSVCQPTGCQINISPKFHSASKTGGAQQICSSNTVRATSPSVCIKLSAVYESRSTGFHLHDSCVSSEPQNLPSSRSNQQPFNPSLTHSSCGHPTQSTSKSYDFVLPNACGDTESHDSNPLIIKIHSDDEDSDTDHDSGIAVVRYNAFLASARSLNARMKKQNKDAFTGRLHPSSCSDADSFFLSAKTQQPTHCMPLRRSHVFSPVSSVEKYRTNNRVDSFNFPDECSALSCNHDTSTALPTFGTQRVNTTDFNCVDTSHHPSRSYHQLRSRNKPSFGHYVDGNEAISGFSNLAQSRHRLKTALESTFSGPGRPKPSVIQKFEESMDWRDVDILTVDQPPADDGYHHTQAEFLRQPLEELQVHKADMQHQARTFLDDLPQEVTVTGIRYDHHNVDSSPYHPLSSSCPSASWL